MKFNFYYHKTANLFHFIANLTEWHFSCRKRYNQIWLDRAGSLISREEEALAQMKKLLLKYNFDSVRVGADGSKQDRFLGIPFSIHSDAEVWERVEEWVTPGEFRTLKSLFEVFEPRFGKIWRIEKPKLESWKDKLTEETAKRRYQNLERELAMFFGQKQTDQLIDVCLLISAVGSGGGANIGPGRITLECTARPAGEVLCVLSTLYHEAAHLVFGAGYYSDLLKKFLQSVRGTPLAGKNPFSETGEGLRTIVNEAVMSNLLPRGYSAHKYFGRSVPSKPKRWPEHVFTGWRLYCAAGMFNFTRDYIENKEPVDTAYLERVWETFEDFAGEYPSK